MFSARPRTSYLGCQPPVLVHKLLTAAKSVLARIRSTGGSAVFRCAQKANTIATAPRTRDRCPPRSDLRRRDQRGTMSTSWHYRRSALTNGISFEALNNISHTTRRFIAVLNDNEWSIAKNVAPSQPYLNKLITIRL